MRRRGVDLQLVIAGHEAERGYLESLYKMCRDLKIDDSVTFILDFATWTKGILYTAADFMVAPSDNLQETLGLALLEGMQAGLPIIATNWSGYRDLVEDGKTGYLLDTWIRWPHKRIAAAMLALDNVLRFPQEMSARTLLHSEGMLNTMTSLTQDADLCRKMGEAARRKYDQEFDEKGVVQDFLDLWEQQIEESRQSSKSVCLTGIDPELIFGHFSQSNRSLLEMWTDEPTDLLETNEGDGNRGSHISKIRIAELLAEDDELAVRSASLLKSGVLVIRDIEGG